MDPTDIAADRWEVTTASHTSTASYYFVLKEVSSEVVKVIVAGKKRTYTWNEAARKKEKVPDEVRREIDKALVRYLTS
jgi:hypothetical protein